MSPAARADRHAQADFADALGHRHQHDVHDADAADDQRDAGDRAEQQRHQPRRLRARGDHFGDVAHGEIVVVAGLDLVALAQEVFDLTLRVGQVLGAIHAERYLLHRAGR